jgi:hypothetical protein
MKAMGLNKANPKAVTAAVKAMIDGGHVFASPEEVYQVSVPYWVA